MRCSALLALLAACPGEEGPLAMPELWKAVDAVDDPFSDRPAEVDCPASGWGLEASPLSVEVDTERCTYLTATQPTGVDLEPGDIVHVDFGHTDLDAEEPAQGHAVVRIGELVVLERVVGIPATEDRWVEDVVIDADVPAGTPAWLHVHNHGANTWNLYDLGVGR